MGFDKKVLAEAFQLYQEEPDKLPAHRVGEVMRCAGANPSTEEVEAAVGTKSHLSLSQVEAAMSKQDAGGDITASTRECLSIFDNTGEGLIEAGEFRSVMANLGDNFSSEEIGQLMLIAEMNADNKFAVDDIAKFVTENSKPGK